MLAWLRAFGFPHTTFEQAPESRTRWRRGWGAWARKRRGSIATTKPVNVDRTAIRRSRSSPGAPAQPPVPCRLVPEVRGEPALGLVERRPPAPGVVGDLVAAEAADGEAVDLGVREVVPAEGSGGEHREALGERDPRVRGRAEKREERSLLGVVGTGWVTGRGPDAAIVLSDQVLARKGLAEARVFGRKAARGLAALHR